MTHKQNAIAVAATLAFLLLLMLCSHALPATIDDEDGVRATIGECCDEGYGGLLAAAVGIRNRGTLKGVYGLKAKHVDRESAKIWELARKAWAESSWNRIHTGDHWGSVKVDRDWIRKMRSSGRYKEVYRWGSTIYFEEIKKQKRT